MSRQTNSQFTETTADLFDRIRDLLFELASEAGKAMSAAANTQTIVDIDTSGRLWIEFHLLPAAQAVVMSLRDGKPVELARFPAEPQKPQLQ